MRRPRSSAVALMAAISGAMGACGGDERQPHGQPSVPPPPAPVVGGAAPDADVAGARRVADEFLRGYLPYLYGRGSPAGIRHVSAAVRTGLARTRARNAPAQRRRRPRVVEVRLVVQRTDALIATALVADGGVATYPLTFTLVHRGERWLVDSLGSD